MRGTPSLFSRFGDTMHLYMSYKKRAALGVSLAAILAGSVLASEIALVTLDFERQALDLDTGSVIDVAVGAVAEPRGADVTFAYNADRTPHAVVVPASTLGVEIAVVDDVAFDGISEADVATLSFSTDVIDVPFEAHDTVVVRTDTGAVFKIGNAVESGFSVTFNYSQLQ